jgi:hypothetical protein
MKNLSQIFFIRIKAKISKRTSNLLLFFIVFFRTKVQILLYKGLIGSVLEYGSVCFTNMAKTHMLGLERVQYRALPGCSWWHTSTGGKIRILELQIPCCCFLSIGSPFEGDAWSAGSAEHGPLHQRIFRCFVIGYSSVRFLHAT